MPWLIFEGNIGANVFDDRLQIRWCRTNIDDELAKLTGADRETAKRITLKIKQILKEELNIDD